MSRLCLCLCLALAGCFAGVVQAGWRDQVQRSASFDLGCEMTVVDEMPEAGGVRYRLAGCGRQAVYVCRDHGRTGDTIVTGGRSVDATCARAQ